MSPADVARISAKSYSYATWTAGELSAFYSAVGNDRVIAIPGTKPEIGEWLRDFDAMPVWDRKLGICHRGFRDGALELYRASGLRVRDFSGSIIVGHSLGGALALLLAGILTVEHCPPCAVVTFGAPRCGSWKLRRLLRRMPLWLYRNGDDPVPDVPWLPGLYLHPRALIPVGERAFDPLADHPIAAYRRALDAMPGAMNIGKSL
jgi:hypothetical protein